MITFVRADGTEFQLPSGPEFGQAMLKRMHELKNSPAFIEKLERRYADAFNVLPQSELALWALYAS